jgi:large subunit ribosomal protein L19
MDVASLIDIKKNPKIPDIAPGDTVKVSARIVEAGKERVQVFQGVVLKIKHGGTGASFTVRHVAFGIGVERTFPFNSPLVEKVEVVRQGKVRRSRLYYLRSLSGKEARRKIKRVERKVRQAGEELIEAEAEEVLVEDMEAPTEEEAAAVAEGKAEVVEEEETEGAVEEKPEAVVVEEAPAEAPEPVAGEEKAAPEEAPAEAPVMEKEEAAEPPAESTEEPEKETS